VFTEHGALMAAAVLSSAKAVEMSIAVVRAFVRLRELLSTHQQLAAKLAELERKLSTHDRHIVALFATIRALMEPSAGRPRRIGFRPPDRGGPDGR
jgi:IS5 family transposase